MPDVVAGPERHVITNRHEGLNSVVFENKAVISHRGTVITCPRTNVSCARITFLLRFIIPRLPNPVRLVVAKSDKNIVSLWWISGMQPLERNQRLAAEPFLRYEFRCVGEGGDFIISVGPEVEFCDLRNQTRAIDDQLFHWRPLCLLNLISYSALRYKYSVYSYSGEEW